MRLKYTITVMPSAQSDLEDILSYVAASSPQNAAALEGRMRHAIDGLEEFPERHPVAGESDAWDKTVRFALVHSYRVMFVVRGREVVVVRVVHGHMLVTSHHIETGE